MRATGSNELLIRFSLAGWPFAINVPNLILTS